MSLVKGLLSLFAFTCFTPGCSLLIDLHCQTGDACRLDPEAAGDAAGDTAGDAAGDVAGDTAGDVAGDAAGDVAGDAAGDEAGAELAPDYHDLECERDCTIVWKSTRSDSSFIIGSNESLSQDEQPERTVNLRGFDVSRSEVTVGQYSRCVAEGACPLPTPFDTMTIIADPSLQSTQTRPAHCSYFKVDAWSLPMNCISFCEALAFVKWMAIDNLGVRLISETEWEFVATSEARFSYPWGGDTPTCTQANMLGCTERPINICELDEGMGVSPSSCDLIGNVREWVADRYTPSYDDLPPNGSAIPFEDDVCLGLGELDTNFAALLGVTRGGDWRSSVSASRSDNRFPVELGVKSDLIGFRVVKPTSF